MAVNAKNIVGYKKWHDPFTTGKLEYLSVNISLRQLADARLINNFKHALMANDVKPEYFLLEITETATMEESAHGQAILKSLKLWGSKFQSMTLEQAYPVLVN